MDRSTPSFSEFNPRAIKWQYNLINDIERNFDYELGVHECLCSGSVGSGKSLPAAHLGISHCLKYHKARVMLGRQSLPDLRETIFRKVIEHLEGTKLQDGSPLRRGLHYDYSDHICKVEFCNGSEIISKTWGDGNYKKFGSLELSAAIIEELTENENQKEIVIKYIRSRVGRLPHVPVNWILYLTNPDSPQHFAYRYFDIAKRQLKMTDNLPKTRHVYFSNTKDNPFLPDWYIDQLNDDMDEKLADRLIRGLWTELFTEVIYHQFREENIDNEEYDIDYTMPVYITFDFNIGFGKPMSCCLAQYDFKKDLIYFFDESVVEGASTEDQMEELYGRGLLDSNLFYIIDGDATGGAKSSKSKLSDYDIIEKFLKKHNIDHKIQVSKSNPPVRERHNRVNAYLKSASGNRRLKVNKKCKTLIEGFKLSSLKKQGMYVEDDSKPYQHVATAAGYLVCSIDAAKKKSKSYERQIR